MKESNNKGICLLLRKKKYNGILELFVNIYHSENPLY